MFLQPSVTSDVVGDSPFLTQHFICIIKRPVCDFVYILMCVLDVAEDEKDLTSNLNPHQIKISDQDPF